MKSFINKVSRYTRRRSFGLFIFRFTTGLVFLMHGWMKIHNIDMIGGFFMSLGLPFWTAPAIAYLEVIGGLALIFGVATRFFGLVFGIEMLVSIFLTGVGKGYQAHELEIVLMLLSFGIALAGSGRYSFYKMECNDCGGTLCSEGAENCPKKV